MKLYLSPKAQYQYQYLKGRSVPYAEQVKTLLKDIQAHPLSGLGSPALVEPSFTEYWERRFNGSGMILYYYSEGEDYVVVVSIINDLLPSHEELPVKLQEASKQDYAQMIRLMEANRGHGNDPKVGIFWYNVAWKELFGVVSHPVRDYTRANASDGWRKTASWSWWESGWRGIRKPGSLSWKSLTFRPIKPPSSTPSTGTSARSGCSYSATVKTMLRELPPSSTTVRECLPTGGASRSSCKKRVSPTYV